MVQLNRTQGEKRQKDINAFFSKKRKRTRDVNVKKIMMVILR